MVPDNIDIKVFSTAMLVAELEAREGVERITAEPYERKEINVEGPAVILVIVD